MSEFVVEATRGPLLETRHRVRVAICDAQGTLVARAAEVDAVVPWRSAAKPFQAMAALDEGTFSHFGWGESELALACASHSSEDRHVALARAMLERTGLDPGALACGPHRPLADSVARAMERAGIAPTPLHSNCSGKHIVMLAMALHRGWPAAGYERADHRVQRRCLAEVARWTEVVEHDIALSVDGCAAVCFGVPLRSMAAAYARLGTSPDPRAVAVKQAMTRRPELVAGERRLCTELMRAYPSDILAKVGASGIYCAAVPKAGLGLALKVEDGDRRAGEVALLRVLDLLGAWPEPPSRRLADFAAPVIHNTRGVVVGRMRGEGELVRENAATMPGQR